MYAYKQQTQYRPIRALPKTVTKTVKPTRIKNKNFKVKKQNPVIAFIKLIITLSLLSIFGIFVLPTSFNCMIKQIVSPTILPTSTGYENVMNNFNPSNNTSVDLYKISKPITNYINNDLFNNNLLLTPVIKKTHSEVTTMYHTTEMTELKQSLKILMNQYPSIKPAIYVWEFDQGQYIDINAEKPYSAASIIKLPVLVRMFKSIEANQFTIYDEMKMIEQYRSTGSGNLQYSPAGQKYTMDNLAKTMIQDSDNTSTNMIMAKLGGMSDINIGLRDWGIESTHVRTWLPDLKGTNKTTALDMAKILYNLDNPGFLNINSREYIIDYMSHVKNDRLIPQGLGQGATFLHKTGDIGSMLGDAGIVFMPDGRKYIVVVMANRPYNSPQGKLFIQQASKIIYTYMSHLG